MSKKPSVSEQQQQGGGPSQAYPSLVRQIGQAKWWGPIHISGLFRGPPNHTKSQGSCARMRVLCSYISQCASSHSYCKIRVMESGFRRKYSSWPRWANCNTNRGEAYFIGKVTQKCYGTVAQQLSSAMAQQRNGTVCAMKQQLKTAVAKQRNRTVAQKRKRALKQ